MHGWAPPLPGTGTRYRAGHLSPHSPHLGTRRDDATARARGRQIDGRQRTSLSTASHCSSAAPTALGQRGVASTSCSPAAPQLHAPPLPPPQRPGPPQPQPTLECKEVHLDNVAVILRARNNWPRPALLFGGAARGLLRKGSEVRPGIMHPARPPPQFAPTQTPCAVLSAEGGNCQIKRRAGYLSAGANGVAGRLLYPPPPPPLHITPCSGEGGGRW